MPATSVLSSVDNRTRANAAIIQAGANGSLSLFASNDAHLLIDVNGYFTTDSSQASFYPVSPCRALDTRSSPGSYLVGGSTRNFPLSGACSVPANVSAYVLNVTTVPRTGYLNYLTVWAAGQNRPGTSTLNMSPASPVANNAVANAAIVAAGTGGQISVYASDDTDLVIDVLGYFAPGLGGLSLYTMGQCRAYDTRTLNNGAPMSGIWPISLANSACGAPSTAGAYLLNAAVTPANNTLLNYLQLWADGTPQPMPFSTLNSRDGAITSNLSITQTVNGSVDAYAAPWTGQSTAYTHLTLDLLEYFAP